MRQKEEILFSPVQENVGSYASKEKLYAPMYKVWKSFNSASKTQKYCSHDCYIKDHFYREEQMEYVIEKLKKGERVENTPQWIKDLLV